jgi:branched-chain amino acid transport system permease protein
VVIANNLSFTGGALGLKNIPNLGTLSQKMLRGWFAEAPLGLSWTQAGNLVVLLVAAVLLTLAVWAVARQGRGRVGRAFAAIRTDEVAAGAMGINTTYYKVLAFAQGAFLAGLAGGLTAHTTYYIGPPDFGFSRAVEMLVFVVVGGTGVPLGPVLGAALLTGLSESLRAFQDFRLIIYGALMMAMVLIRPQGILTPLRRAAARRRKAKGVAA